MPPRVLLVLLVLTGLLAGGTSARAAGVDHGDDFGAAQPVEVAAPDAPRARARRTVTAGARSLAVVLVNFSNDTSEPWTPDEVEERVLTGEDSANAFYEEDSHGQVSFYGDVLGWYTIAAANTGCDTGAVVAGAAQAAAEEGKALYGYAHVMFVVPPTEDCEWSGLGHLNGPYSWINGTLDTNVLAHELGHNLGVHHAAAYVCSKGDRPVAVAPEADCGVWEYGDPFSVMGAYALRHNHAWHLSQLGFVAASKVRTITESGTYTVRSPADPAASPVALRIPRTRDEAGEPLDYYYLDVRSPWGAVDAFSPSSAVVNGVSIRLAPDASNVRQSYLIDTTPGTSAWPNSFADGALAAGRRFTEGDVSITTLEAGNGEATVAVLLGGEQPDEPPAAEAAGGDEPQPQPDPPAEEPSPRPAEPPPPTVTPTAAPAATLAPAPDTARPRVVLRAKRRNRRIRITATATDDRAVARLELWVDGRRRRVAASGSVTWSRALRRGRHVVVVKAFDAAGNAAVVRTRVR
ncbi:MAG TPA: hypothetical protein VF587_01975 [Solirubrobacteraceae bacterium]|jgi:hypothetical protein